MSPNGVVTVATEWSDGQVINLGGLPGFTMSNAVSINDAGQVVGWSYVGGLQVATEWSNGQVIDLGGLPDFFFSSASSINDAGQVVGTSTVGETGRQVAVEWSNGQVIDLASGFSDSIAASINDVGQVVGEEIFLPVPIPESSTWAMMVLGFAGLGFVGYRPAGRCSSRTVSEERFVK